MPLLLSKAVKKSNRQSRPAQLRKKSIKNKGSKPRQGWELRLLDAVMWFAGAVKVKTSVEVTVCLQLAVKNQ